MEPPNPSSARRRILTMHLGVKEILLRVVENRICVVFSMEILLFKRLFTSYHGKSPLNHHLGICCIFPTTLSKSKNLITHLEN